MKYLPFIYGAYGSNLNKAQMQRRCPDAVPLDEPYLLNGYALKFRGVADIERSQDETVTLGLWHITQDCLEALDYYEGFPSLYRRESVAIHESGVPVMVYIMNRQEQIYPPAQHYLQAITDGYSDFGMRKEELIDAVKNSYTSTCYGQAELS